MTSPEMTIDLCLKMSAPQKFKTPFPWAFIDILKYRTVCHFSLCVCWHSCLNCLAAILRLGDYTGNKTTFINKRTIIKVNITHTKRKWYDNYNNHKWLDMGNCCYKNMLLWFLNKTLNKPWEVQCNVLHCYSRGEYVWKSIYFRSLPQNIH